MVRFDCDPYSFADYRSFSSIHRQEICRKVAIVTSISQHKWNSDEIYVGVESGPMVNQLDFGVIWSRIQIHVYEPDPGVNSGEFLCRISPLHCHIHQVAALFESTFEVFDCFWLCNRFDFIVAAVSLVGLVLQLVSSDFHVIAIVRPLRVLRSVIVLH